MSPRSLRQFTVTRDELQIARAQLERGPRTAIALGWQLFKLSWVQQRLLGEGSLDVWRADLSEPNVPDAAGDVEAGLNRPGDCLPPDRDELVPGTQCRISHVASPFFVDDISPATLHGSSPVVAHLRLEISK
jgi:hypothetical protein